MRTVCKISATRMENGIDDMIFLAYLFQNDFLAIQLLYIYIYLSLFRVRVGYNLFSFLLVTYETPVNCMAP